MPAVSSSSPTTTVAVINSDMSTTTSRWASSFPDDLVRHIGSLLLAGDLLDYVRFRAVCSAWRSATASPRGRGVVDPRFHPRRWMMLPEGDGLHPGHPKLRGYVRFFNLDTGAFVRVRIPLFQDHCALDSLDGLLVLQRDHDTAVRLLHPFTGDIVDLPPLSTLPPQVQELAGCAERKKLPIIRNIFAAATFADDGVVTVMLAIKNMYRVAFAASHDRQWTVSTWYYEISRPLLSSQGKIYVACEMKVRPVKTAERRLLIFQMDTPLPGEVLQPPKVIAACPLDKLREPVYLVECGSEVLVIGHTEVSRSKMVVYKLADLIMGMEIPLISIGDKAIFIQERALSVSAKALPTVTGDTVTCTHRVERCLAQYHIGSGTWSLAMDQCSLDGIEPGPCSFIHYIITCCTRSFWNKGLLIRRKKIPCWMALFASMASMAGGRASSSRG